jgi:hypothetical protein
MNHRKVSRMLDQCLAIIRKAEEVHLHDQVRLGPGETERLGRILRATRREVLGYDDGR